MFSKNKTLLKIILYIGIFSISFFLILFTHSQTGAQSPVSNFRLEVVQPDENICFHEEFGQIDCETREAFRPYNQNIQDIDRPRSPFWKWARGAIHLRYRPYTVTSD